MKRANVGTTVLAALLVAGLAGRANASTILLDLEDPAGQSGTPFALPFVATDASTTVEFAGYQVPSFEQAEDIMLQALGAGPNLLGMTWTFTPAPSGSLANPFDDGFGTGTNAVNFGGVVEDSFDRFAQTIATVPGVSYTLSFQFGNSFANAPSELLVSTSAGAAAVPEPASLMLLGTGLFGVIRAVWRSKKTAVGHIRP